MTKTGKSDGSKVSSLEPVRSNDDPSRVPNTGVECKSR